MADFTREDRHAVARMDMDEQQEADEGAKAAVEGRDRAKVAALAALATGGLDASIAGPRSLALSAGRGGFLAQSRECSLF